MRNIVIALAIAVMAATAAPAASASIASPARAAAAHHVTVLGKRHLFGRYGVGWGKAHPKRIFNGGDPSGLVRRIKWSHWGSATTTGRGWGNGFKPSGGYYAKPVRTILKARHLGHCTAYGPSAYTVLWVKQQKRPGGSHYTKWFRWAGLSTICARHYA